VSERVPRERIEAMYRAYVEGVLSMDEVGRAFGIGGERVSKLFEREGLPAITHAERGGSLTVPERVERGDRIAAALPRYDRDYLAECVAMAAAEDGTESLSLKRYQELAREWGLPSGARVTQVFGSWRAACRAAGLRPNPPGRGNYRRGFTYEDALAALRDCAAELGHVPSDRQYDEWQRRARPANVRGYRGPVPVGDAGPQPVAAQALGAGGGRRVRRAARIGSVPTLRRKGCPPDTRSTCTATWRGSATRSSGWRHRDVPLPARAAARQRGRQDRTVEAAGRHGASGARECRS
jgi:hypothetical protein